MSDRNELTDDFFFKEADSSPPEAKTTAPAAASKPRPPPPGFRKIRPRAAQFAPPHDFQVQIFDRIVIFLPSPFMNCVSEGFW